MAKKKQLDHYSSAEDKIIIYWITLFPTNINYACLMAKTQLPKRSLFSIKKRWYKILSKQTLVYSVVTVNGATFNRKGSISIDNSEPVIVPEKNNMKEMSKLISAIRSGRTVNRTIINVDKI